MTGSRRGAVKKSTTVYLAVFIPFTSVTAAWAEEENGVENAVVSIFADLKAKASVDGAAMGFTPVGGLELAPGPHAFEFTYQDYAPQEYELEIAAGVTDLYFQLEPRLEEPKNKFGAVDLAILIGVVGGAVVGFVIWRK